MTALVSARILDRPAGRIAFVTVDNAAKLNSLTSEVMTEFVRVFRDLAQDPDLRVAVLTGAGDKAFIGGASIDEMAALSGPDAARAFIEKVHGCCQAVRDLPAPVIARINGYCLGAGLEIAAACDLRVAAEGALLGMPEVKLGLPSVVEAAILPMLTGWGRARWMLMTGETFGAAQAQSWGLVEAVYPLEELDLAVDALAAALLDAEPNAVRLQKRLMRRWENLPLSEAIAAGVEAFAEAWTTEAPRRALGDYLAAREARRRR
jgi:enoyl-CoA hydratase/carnithine racemase